MFILIRSSWKARWRRSNDLQEKYVLTAIERGGWRSFAVPIPDRGAKTVKAIVKSKVFPGTLVKAPLEEDVVSTSELRTVRCLIHDLIEKMPQPASEDMIPVYLAQWMWRKINEIYKGDVFTQMIENVSQAFPFTAGDSNMRKHASAFCKPDDTEEVEEICTQLILVPNKPPVVNKFVKQIVEDEPVVKKSTEPKKKPTKITYRKPSSKQATPRTSPRISPRLQIVRSPPPGLPARAY